MKLRDLIVRYVTFKQSLGLRYRSEAQVLRAFGRAMGARDLSEVTPTQVLACQVPGAAGLVLVCHRARLCGGGTPTHRHPPVSSSPAPLYLHH
jgi:hypothetical protein